MKNLLKTTTATVLVTTALSIPAFAGTTISVDLWDAGSDMTMVTNMRMMNHMNMMGMDKAPMGIRISEKSVAAGEITFNAVNSSKVLEHEMVVAKLKNDTTELPYKEDSAEVDEDAPNMNLGEISELEPGEKGSLTVTLNPGKYVLFCNIAGHYASGMWTILTVN